jgi:hypothetical protein
MKRKREMEIKKEKEIYTHAHTHIEPLLPLHTMALSSYRDT